MDEVSYLTINGETREIVDKTGRNRIELLEAQVEYIAEQLNIDLSNVVVDEN